MKVIGDPSASSGEAARFYSRNIFVGNCCIAEPGQGFRFSTHFPSLIRTGEAARESIRITLPLFLSICPNVSTPVGHDWTHALHLTHSGSLIGRPLLAKFIMSIPW